MLHPPGAQALGLASSSRPPLSPMYRSDWFGSPGFLTNARLKIGLWRVVLATKSTVAVALLGLLTRASSVGAVVLRFRNPTYSAPLAPTLGSMATPWARWPSRPWPGATITGLHRLSGPARVPFAFLQTLPAQS